MGILTEPAWRAFLPFCCFLVLKDNFSVSKTISRFQRLLSSHAPTYFFLPFSLSISLRLPLFFFFLSDFSGLCSYRGPFVIDLWPGSCKELPGREPGSGPTSGEAEFNTSLCFVSGQSKPTTPLQSAALLAPHPGGRQEQGFRGEGRGRSAAPAGTYRGRQAGWLFLWGLVRHLGPQPPPH